MYVVLDGFDLGVGILFPFAPGESARDAMINSVAPVWDGNETWLVLGGGGLLVFFPTAYSIALPAFYIPIMAMLFALIFRGVTFEFRHTAHTSVHLWNRSFFFGSLIAAFMQGVLRRCAGAGRACRGDALCGRHVRLADALHGSDRHRRRRGLRPSWRGLADLQDRRSVAGLGATRGRRARWRCAGRDGCRQRDDAAPAAPPSPNAGSAASTSFISRRCRS